MIKVELKAISLQNKMETKKYQVLGVKGNKVNILGTDYDARVDFVELTDEEAAPLLAESKVALVIGEGATTQAPENSSTDEGEEDDGEGEDEGEEDGGEDEGEDEGEEDEGEEEKS